jgi:protoheme IX farnesyltransferase
MARIRFEQYAWGLLVYNLAVILGGAFVRASVSGDGCGAHWPTCNGSLFPEGDRTATLIEYGHRLSTGVLLPLVIGLVVWAYRAYPKGSPVRRGAAWVLGFTLLEAAIGAALVLFRWVAHDRSTERAIAMPAHLIATFGLLAWLTLTGWWARGGKEIRLRGQGLVGWALGLGLLGTLMLGVSGAIAALGDTLFPAASLAEGIRQDLSPGAHFLIGLRIYHPVFAIAMGFYLALISALCMTPRFSERVHSAARLTVLLFAMQMVVGVVNLVLLAPIWMQLIHLLVADLYWVSLVVLAATALSEPARERAAAPDAPAAPGAAVGPPVEAQPAATWRDYLALTKPRVISLLLLTTLAAMVIAAGAEQLTAPGFGLYLAVGLGLYMAAGSANAINMVLERDLDLRMGRTATRPTVTARISVTRALLFAAALAIGSFVLLWWSANLLAALMAQAGLAFYILIYTLLLKRRTPQNIVIGGAAGAFPPLVGWAAVTGDLGPLAWCLFAIVFLWTPVHFWALALLIKEDYARAGVPMLPVVRGVRATVTQIAGYAVLTAAISALPVLLRGPGGQSPVGWFYLAAAALLNAGLLLRSFQLYRTPDHPHARSLFKYSMVYLALLFLAMAVDQAPFLQG